MGLLRPFRGLPLALITPLLFASPADAQFIDEHFEPLPTVPAPGMYAPSVQAAIEEGYEQLAAVTSPEDDTRLEAAKDAFERALRENPDAAHALNGLGIYEITKDEQWLVLLETLKKVFERDHISMAIKRFEDALDRDPDLHEARYNLALAHRQTRGADAYRKAAEVLEDLIDRAPDFADVAYLYVVTLRDVGEIDQMREAIERLGDTPAFPASGRYLMEAYALINSDRGTEGAEAYWRGVEAIASEREADLYWYDIRPIVSVQVSRAFENLDTERRKAYLREFWQTIADESFVTPDERLIEHYRRLYVVYENYRLELPERRHYSSSAAYVPEEQTGFDDRGMIYLRHGEPDDTATYSGPAVEQNMSWKYVREGSDPLVFHFVADEDIKDFKLVRRLGDAIIQNSTKLSGQQSFNPNCGVGGACDSYDARILASDLVAFRDLYSSRGHLDPYYDRVATGLDEQTLEREELDLAEHIAVGTTSQSYRPAPAESPLPYPIQPVAFRGPGGDTVVSFYYALPTSEINVLPHSSGGSEIDYRYQLVVSSPETGDAMARQEDDVVVASQNPIPRDAGVMLPGVRTVAVPPGEYRYGMKVTDLNSGRFGVKQGAVTAHDFSRPGLSMSGVVLANRVEPSSANSAFVRWGRLKVLPLPSRMFKRQQSVFVYYEVYGLAGTAGEGARFRTTYTLASAVPDRNVVARFFSAVGELLTRDDEKGGVTYSFERSESGSIDPLLEYFSLDVSESPAGDYVLTVAVEDLETGQSVERQVSLTLVD